MKQAISILLAVVSLLSLLAGCAAETGAKSDAYQFEDALGYTVTVESTDHVAAIGGSNAETWLLAGGELAALTEDAYSERGIEPSEDVVNLGTVKSPDVETMILTGVDFVILNAKIAEHVALRTTLENAGMTTAYFSVETFDDYLSMLKICTDLTGHPEIYVENGLAIQAQIDEVIAQTAGKKSEAPENVPNLPNPPTVQIPAQAAAPSAVTAMMRNLLPQAPWTWLRSIRP